MECEPCIKLGFLGPRELFPTKLCLFYSKGKSYTACDYSSIQELLQAVQSNEVDEAIAPIENSIEGAVNATLDILASEVDLLIRSELVIPVRENLLVKKGTALNGVKHILSHPQPPWTVQAVYLFTLSRGAGKGYLQYGGSGGGSCRGCGRQRGHRLGGSGGGL